jgi:uroporphyrin-III C-methyltransferase/precorrin-2 dehydrogenase/sirohydrochlorin ferrochelatase
MPVAIVENGSRPDQRVSLGQLSDLARLAALRSDAGPALIIVGEVAALAAADRPANQPVLAEVS